jgi:predicted O-methyltransferase YrrM
LYFDSQSGLINKIGSYWELQEYKEIDNIKLPTKIVMSRKGGSSSFLFEEIVHNSDINDSTFINPDAGEVFSDVFEGIDNETVLPLLKGESFNHQNMNVPYRDAWFIYDMILEKGYKRGLETGTYNGYSALWMGLAFQKTGGKLITIEIDSLSSLEAQKYFQISGLNNIINLRINDAFKEIPTIEGTFDFVFIDAQKKDYLDFLKLLVDRTTPGAAIVAHNVTNYAHDMKEFLDAILDNPKIKTSFHKLSAEGLSVSIAQK